MHRYHSAPVCLVLILSQAIFLSVNLVLAQPGNPVASLKTSVLVLFDSSDPYGEHCFQQTLISLRYARIPYRSLDLSKTSSVPPLDEFSSVLITTEMIWKLDVPSCRDLETFVRRGGGLAVLFRGWNPELGDLFGIQNRANIEIDSLRSRGLIFTQEFLPGVKGIKINDLLLADISSFALDLDSTDNVFATTWNGHYPVAWIRRFGEGKVVYWNASLLAEKIYRGFLIATIGCIQPFTATLIMDLSTVCLDDFPLPASNQKPEPIKSEFDETSTQFYYLRWYPDMMSLSKLFGIKYTTALIFNYAEMTSPPYTFVEWSRSDIEVAGKPINAAVWTARQNSRVNEMAFHGHNHLPLVEKNWGNVANMELALKAAKRRWEMDNLGPEPTSYIPPMNVIDSVGLNSLLTVFPKIRVVASQYLGTFERGQRREFGPDPWNKNVTDIPRMTSGYVMDDFNKMETISMIHTFGAWNHFVHPDDVIPTPGRYQENVREDENVDAAGWYDKPKEDGLFYRFRTWLQFVKDHYPWIRSVTLSEARDIVLKYATTSSTLISQGNKIRLLATKAPAYFMLYLPIDNSVVSAEGGTVIHEETMTFSRYYVLACDNGQMAVTLKNSVPAMSFKGSEQGDLYRVDKMARYEMTFVPRPKPLPLETTTSVVASAKMKTDLQRAEELIGAGNQVAAIRLLEHAALQRPDDLRIWRQLRQLYDWNNMPEKALNAYETIVRLEPADIAAMKVLAQRYIWANRLNDAILMNERILRREPNNVALMKTLAEEYLSTNRQLEAIEVYKKLSQREPRNVNLLRTLAELYFWNSNNDRGIGAYEQILTIEKSDTSVLRILAEKYMEVDRQKDALRTFERLLAHRPHDTELRKRIAQVYVWNNEGMKATQQYEAILATNVNDIQIRKTLARMYVENNAPDKAIVQLRIITQQDPKDISSLKRLGELYLWREKQKEAVPTYEKIVASEPDSLAYRVMLGQLYVWTKKLSAAKNQFAEVVKRDRRNVTALSQLADIERNEANWNSASEYYEEVLAIDGKNKDARSALEDIRREHGLLFTSSYERIEDSNNLSREQIPMAAGIFQTGNLVIGFNAVRQNIRDNKLQESQTGYGIGLAGKYTLSQQMALSATMLATSYASGWVPLSIAVQANNTITSRLYSTLKFKTSETTEGVQAIKSKIILNSGSGELYFQMTDRLSISGLAESDWYSDNNAKTTLAGFSTYKLMLGAPIITLLANYAYQDSKVIYRSSVPYWTPSKLSTSSFGLDAAVGLFETITIDAAYLNTLQAGVFSSNVRAQIAWRPTLFAELSLYYEKLGSRVYSQNTLRAVFQYRY